jgi:hypothetical protein
MAEMVKHLPSKCEFKPQYCPDNTITFAISSKVFAWPEDVTPWKSTCLACLRPWVPAPAPGKIKFYFNVFIPHDNLCKISSFCRWGN